ncbi:MAG: hypothetical protein Edafosvirus23_4 [Edafosvirus sp.]|uniref:Uncharacterized protein n=1 Tax=Edafosvirus sp. TaxID=2487765 RepID=A0A3G4ZUU1_9VIRU|nr:MAG: hypothetical protein Edafosvirus23_4 [Edafosvirus sp.]
MQNMNKTELHLNVTIFGSEQPKKSILYSLIKNLNNDIKLPIHEFKVRDVPNFTTDMLDVIEQMLSQSDIVFYVINDSSQKDFELLGQFMNKVVATLKKRQFYLITIVNKQSFDQSDFCEKLKNKLNIFWQNKDLEKYLNHIIEMDINDTYIYKKLENRCPVEELSEHELNSIGCQIHGKMQWSLKNYELRKATLVDNMKNIAFNWDYLFTNCGYTQFKKLVQDVLSADQQIKFHLEKVKKFLDKEPTYEDYNNAYSIISSIYQNYDSVLKSDILIINFLKLKFQQYKDLIGIYQITSQAELEKSQKYSYMLNTSLEMMSKYKITIDSVVDIIENELNHIRYLENEYYVKKIANVYDPSKLVSIYTILKNNSYVDLEQLIILTSMTNLCLEPITMISPKQKDTVAYLKTIQNKFNIKESDIVNIIFKWLSTKQKCIKEFDNDMLSDPLLQSSILNYCYFLHEYLTEYLTTFNYTLGDYHNVFNKYIQLHETNCNTIAYLNTKDLEMKKVVKPPKEIKAYAYDSLLAVEKFLEKIVSPPIKQVDLIVDNKESKAETNDTVTTPIVTEPIKEVVGISCDVPCPPGPTGATGTTVPIDIIVSPVENKTEVISEVKENVDDTDEFINIETEDVAETQISAALCYNN